MNAPWYLVLSAMLLTMPVATADTPAGPHADAACDTVTVIVVVDGNCWGKPGQDGCHGVVIILASDNNCQGADATREQTAGQGCEDAIVVNLGGNGNCRGGDA